MDRYVISLQRTPERLQTFLEANRHVPGFTHFRAIDGRTLDRKLLIDKGMIDDNLTFSPGFIGSALSHIMLWRQVYENGEPGLICEDDAFLCADFEAQSQQFMATLPADWDMIWWTWNFDSVLNASIGATPLTFLAWFDQNEMRQQLASHLASPPASIPLRLRHAFGISCYSLSPSGAGKLLASLVPLRDGQVFIPGLNKNVRYFSIDVMMNSLLGQMNAYAAWPPMALTPNEAATSTNLEAPAGRAVA